MNSNKDLKAIYFKEHSLYFSPKYKTGTKNRSNYNRAVSMKKL